MKPTLSNLEKRLEALETSPQLATEEPLLIHIVEVDTNGREVTKEWNTTRRTHPVTGREIIVEEPV